jgi:hypothetical protein
MNERVIMQPLDLEAMVRLILKEDIYLVLALTVLLSHS